MICTGIDDLSCGFSGNSKMKFILNGSVEFLSNIRIFIVINAALGKNICNLLPDTPLAGPDGANPFQQFFEIVFAEQSCSLL